MSDNDGAAIRGGRRQGRVADIGASRHDDLPVPSASAAASRAGEEIAMKTMADRIMLATAPGAGADFNAMTWGFLLRDDGGEKK